MLSDRDIDKLMKAFSQTFPTKEEVRSIIQQEVGETTKATYESVEHLVSAKETERFENAARDTQLSRHDGWIKQIAKQSDIKLVDA